MTRALWLALTALLAGVLLVTPVWAQGPQEQLQAALQAGEAALSNAQVAVETDDPSVARARLTDVLANLQQAQSFLTNVLTTATDDATRSRAAGLLDHVNAARSAAEAGLAGPHEQLRAAADAARGEINEALSELRVEVAFPSGPQPSPQPSLQPGQLPRAGGLPMDELSSAALVASGLLLISSGLLLRQSRAGAQA